MTDVLEPRDAVRAIATFGLPEIGPTEPFTVEDDRWDDVLVALGNERLDGLAIGAIDEGFLDVPDTPRRSLIDRYRESSAHCLRLEQELFRIADALERSGVPLVVLKGPALAHTVYPDPSWRPFRDLDLLVRTRDWRTACDLLADVGCVRKLPEPRRGFDERFGKAATHRTPSGLEVDLHRTLVLGPFGLWIRADELFEHTSEFNLAGRLFIRLDDTALLVHACVHAALGQQEPYGQQLRDISQVLSKVHPDAGYLQALARRWRLGPVIRRAFELEASLVGGGWPVAFRPVLAQAPSAQEQRLLRAYTSERRGNAGTALTSLRAISGVRNRLAYTFALAFPTNEFMEQRSGFSGTRARMNRLSIPLLRRRSLRSLRPGRFVPSQPR